MIEGKAVDVMVASSAVSRLVKLSATIIIQNRSPFLDPVVVGLVEACTSFDTAVSASLVTVSLSMSGLELSSALSRQRSISERGFDPDSCLSSSGVSILF